MKTKILFTLLFFACRIHYLYGQTNLQIAPETLATPEKMEYGYNLLKIQSTTHWGFANGIRIGIAPLGGPRGLIRIYTPYLEHDEFVVTNFIAFEPIDKAKIIGGSQNWNGVNLIMFVENVFGVGILLKLPHSQINIIQLTE